MSDETTTRGAAVPKQATPEAPALGPTDPPDYFGFVPNYANSPLPTVVGGVVQPGTGIRKFIDTLPGLGPTKANDLGNYLPVATPDTITYPGSDYYEIGLQQYSQQTNRDLPATRLRGYKQLNNGTDPSGHNTVAPPARPYYLGPVILAHRNRPVRIKFVNQLPTGPAGKLFLPVDVTIGGAGTGPLSPTELYTQNRAVVHMHGSETPWISDGTPLQWITPAGEVTSYPRGASVADVPDMPPPGGGAVTLYYPMQQSARMMWFHDHTEGTTHLNPYSGQLSFLLLDDPVEQQLVTQGVIPAEQIPLVIQDKTYVPDPAQLAAQDPTWDTANWGGKGNFWYPHVYMPNQNPYNETGTNPMGRWDYGPWFWPPFTGIEQGPVPNPYYDPVNRPWEPPVQPGTPLPTITPEAFMDTPAINGCDYPVLNVQPKAYRFRILNACNDRMLNLQLYYAASNGTMWNPNGSLADGDAGEVPMVEACPNPDFPPTWPTDGREGGVPDPDAVGPDWLQIGNEGGLLPGVAVIPPQPINYEYDRRSITVLNVSDHSLLLGPAERADVIVDFSSVPPGTNLILYNDAPAPMPAYDTRYDYYTGDPDQTDTGGAPTTQPGWGPNTRTIMQIRVNGTPAAPFNLAQLQTRLPQAYAQSQPKPIVPEEAYNTAFGTDFPNTYVAIQDTTITFTPMDATGPVTLDLQPKAIVEEFDPVYGRMMPTLGVELPKTSAFVQTSIPLPYINPPTEILYMSNLATPVGSTGDGTQLWKITHNGVDTHPVHFHYFNVQLVNRVGWDGAYKPPDANELGWKDTVRMNPLEDVIVAMRPALPTSLPFKIGDSVRLLDPTQVPGTTNGFAQIDPATGEPATVTNVPYNFGWEYVWHCHMVDHEDFDMMRPVVIRVSPQPPTNLTLTVNPGSLTVKPTIVLNWTNPTGPPPATLIVVQRATDAAFTTGLTTYVIQPTLTSFTDPNAVPGVTYYYRVRRENAAAYSAWTNVVSGVINLAAPTGLTAVQGSSTPIRVVLNWTLHSYSTSVELQRATNATFTTGVVTFTLAAGATTYTDTPIPAGTTYYYRVRTTFNGGSSPWSNVASVAVYGAPAAPTNLAATVTPVPQGTVTVNLTWQESAASVVEGFVLQRATNATFTANLVAIRVLPGTARSYSDTGRARSTTYYYRIQAYNAVGTGPYSNIIAVTTPA
ncbi:multicopper oxidase domain-containing protein [Micromonospora sp. R77]|uniref:multicopper oxidase domain-containing protein n=1 Tax=Micromonospora sp. R77 TaxID=2925836 RepID=UPI001F60B6C6|nr:multicopper oxidase domain-containing protein [Micromonospora sp. R77]MCI4063062.1 multicopper oxidase domain-containing protein [Micromonospora sp. R77]